MTSIQKRALYLLVGSQLLIMLGIGLVIPVEPYIKTEMGLTAMDMGIMAALFAAVQFIASPKSYHSLIRSFTLNDGVRSFRNGEKYQYCSDFICCAWWPSCARKSTMRTCFASAMVIYFSFS